MIRRLLALALALTLTACAPDLEGVVDDPEEFVEEEDQGKADGASLVYLYFKLSSGKLTVKEKTTTPLPGAPVPLTDFTCAPRFTWQGVERVECKRGSASLEVLYRTAKKTAVSIFRPKGRATDQRTFSACTTTNTRAPFPTYLRCTWKAPSQSGGGLRSPIPPTIAGFPIPNGHWVGGGEQLLRAMAPGDETGYQALSQLGIKAVLVFKKPTGTGSDVADELGELRERGFADANVLNVPFLWKDFPDYVTPCKETLQGLRFLRDQLQAGRKTFFHCTVGEDRTGFLSGLYRLLQDPQASLPEIFHGELCERGYSAGNPLKPVMVTSKIAVGLTPLFRKLVHKIRKGELTTALEESVCSNDPAGESAFKNDPALAPALFECGTSTLFKL